MDYRDLQNIIGSARNFADLKNSMPKCEIEMLGLNKSMSTSVSEKGNQKSDFQLLNKTGFN